MTADIQVINPATVESDWLERRMREVIPAASGMRARIAEHEVSMTCLLPASGGQITIESHDNSSQMSRIMSSLTFGQLKRLVVLYGSSFSIEAATTETAGFKYSSLRKPRRISR
ncbi:MAG: hypothetical protein ACXW1E_04685 [Halobacteriota archaeon]